MRRLAVAGLDGERDRRSPLPAGIVAGEKVAVAPEGNPDAVKVTASG
jgi:hypothetical protein